MARSPRVGSLESSPDMNSRFCSHLREIADHLREAPPSPACADRVMFRVRRKPLFDFRPDIVRRNVVGPTASPTPGQHKQPTEALDTGVGSHRPLVSTTNVKALLERKTNSLRGGDLQRLYIYPRSDKDRSDVADRFLSS